MPRDAQRKAQGTRQEVLHAVQQAPGCTIKQIALRLRVSHSTAIYHLAALARQNLVTQRREGRELHNFAQGALLSRRLYLAALLRTPRKADFLRFLASHPGRGMTINKLATGAGVEFGFAKRTLLQLGEIGVLRVERRNYRYTIEGTAGLLALLQATDGATGLATRTDS